MAVTLKEIAVESGVSPPVVSLVLNNKGQRFRPETRKRVLRAAHQLGYRPNVSARSMATGRFGCVALLLTTNREFSHLPVQLLDGIQAELADHELHLTIAQIPDEKLTSEGFVPKILREYLADGMLVNYHYRIPEKMTAIIREHNIPSIWMNVRRDRNCVYPDEFAAGRRAVEHLVALGHRRIGFVDYSHGKAVLDESHFSAADRAGGYLAGMKDAGLTPRVVRGDGRSVPYVERLAFTREWLTAAERPTAVACYSTDTAGAVMAAALKVGLDVPGDLSVMAFDDHASHMLGAPMTTLLLPNFEMGREAVRMVLTRIEPPPKDLPAVAVDYGFKAGHTCAPCSAEAS